MIKRACVEVVLLRNRIFYYITGIAGRIVSAVDRFWDDVGRMVEDETAVRLLERAGDDD